MDQELKTAILEAFGYAIAAVQGQLSRAKVETVRKALEAEKLRFEDMRSRFMKLETKTK